MLPPPRSTRPFASPQIGWAEQNPEDWWRACCIAVRQALTNAGLQPVIKSRASDFPDRCTAPSCWTIADKVVRPALIWCDLRSEKQCRDLTERIGPERLIRLTCNPALPNFTLTKFLWVRENEPENWKRVSLRHAAQGLRSLPPHRRAGHRHGRCLRHIDAGCRESPLVSGSSASGGDRRVSAASAVRVPRCLRKDFRSRSRSDRLTSGNSGRGRSGRSGCGRGRHGNRRTRRGKRDHRNLRSGVRGHRPARPGLTGEGYTLSVMPFPGAGT